MIKISKLMSTLELIANNPEKFGIDPHRIDEYDVRIIQNGYEDFEMMSIRVEHGSSNADNDLSTKSINIELNNIRGKWL
jgi:hypothetical protein